MRHVTSISGKILAATRTWLTSLVVVVLVGLSACAQSVGTSGAAGPGTGPDSGLVSVRPGDTVYSVTRRYGVSQRELIEMNGLRPPYLLRVGQSLRISTQRIHTVRPGDTVSEIAELYGVSQRDLVDRNGLRPPYLIRVGDRLSVPGGRGPGVSTDGSDGLVIASRTPRPVAPPAPSQPPPRTSNQGDGQPWSSGGRLYFPVPAGTRVPLQDQTAANPADGPPVPTPRPGANGVSEPTPPPIEVVPTSAPARSTVRPVGDLTPPPLAGRFAWPLKGRIIGGFGPRESGLHNDGLNIAAPTGTPIRAAENGVVVYAGNELRGFGNLLLIKHADGWVTAYAHADTLKVGRGDQVRRGDVIATVGDSGNVGQPQLHFEIRKGQQAIDPRKHLPSTQTSSDLRQAGAVG